MPVGKYRDDGTDHEEKGYDEEHGSCGGRIRLRWRMESDIGVALVGGGFEAHDVGVLVGGPG